ncbi:MAG TPA: nitrate ABC transporter, permease protein, partial [Cellvibrio sp.]
MSEASITSGITEDSRSLSLRLKNLGNYLTVRVVPALVVIGILVAIWQITCSRPDSNLPSATTVFE